MCAGKACLVWGAFQQLLTGLNATHLPILASFISKLTNNHEVLANPENLTCS